MKSSFYMPSRKRRRGVAMVYVGMFFIFFVSVTAFSIDLARLYSIRARAQQAADAAALAGAYQYSQLKTAAEANDNAIAYAAKPENGTYYEADPVRKTSVKLIYQPIDEFGVQQMSWYRVSISREEPTFFAGIFGKEFRKVKVGAQSTAFYETNVGLDTTNVAGGTYGVGAGSPTNLALFGPDGWYDNGDKYSVRTLSNRTTPNPDYLGLESNKSKKGYDFLITVPQSFKNANSMAYFQIFDPDCYNAGNNPNPNSTERVDEMRTSAGGLGLTDPAKNNASTATTTRYQLYRDNGTPNNFSDDFLIASRDYGSDPTADMKWNDMFSGNPKDLNKVNEGLRINVMTIGGSSENGFALRLDNKAANAPGSFDSNNGTKITADGKIPINFNTSGTVSMTLGDVPINAKGTKLSITKFDTDVSSTQVRYFCDPAPSNQPSGGYVGVLSTNGKEVTDTITLPSNYQGGKWRAVYGAGTQDTSVWSMSYAGAGSGSPGSIGLIR